MRAHENKKKKTRLIKRELRAALSSIYLYKCASEDKEIEEWLNNGTQVTGRLSSRFGLVLSSLSLTFFVQIKIGCWRGAQRFILHVVKITMGVFLKSLVCLLITIWGDPILVRAIDHLILCACNLFFAYWNFSLQTSTSVLIRFRDNV